MAVKPEPVQAFLKEGPFATLGAQLEEQGRLRLTAREGLPKHLASHCQHCVPKDERLLIYADSPAFASQVRFFGPSLLARFQQAGWNFREVQVHNLMPVAVGANPKPRPNQTKPPGAHVADMLRESAENLPKEIGEALRRLSRTLDNARRA